MEKNIQSGRLNMTLGSIAAQLGAALDGPEDFFVERLASAETSDPAGLAFAESPAYVGVALASGVGALLAPDGLDCGEVPVIRTPSPRLAFMMLLRMTDQPVAVPLGIHPTAVISPDAVIAASVQVGPYAVVEADAILREGATVFAFGYVGPFCELKAGAVLGPHAVLVKNVVVGERSVIGAGTVLGGDGFGFVWDGKQRVKVPQVGRVELGSDVEIGTLTCVDRATAGVTTIGDGTKLDNLIQVGHNCSIGAHSVIAAACAIGGSTHLGARTVVGGAAAFADHVKVGDDITIGGRAGVTSDLIKPGAYSGLPAVPMNEARRNMVSMAKLSTYVGRIRSLERRLAALEKGAEQA